MDVRAFHESFIRVYQTPSPLSLDRSLLCFPHQAYGSLRRMGYFGTSGTM